MSAYRDNRAFAEAGYLDLRGAPAPYIPTSQEEADFLLAEHRRECAERAARIAGEVVEDRAALRRACTTNHVREVREAASRFRYALAAAHRDGFDVPHRDEISELMSRTVIKLREQQEAA